jgi:hypothetical protein
METYRITSDIERIETSVTVAGRRIGVRAAFLLLIGLLFSIGLIGLLAPTLGSPSLFFPIGLVPLYIAALIAFVRPGDGRPIEMQLLDRVRFARTTKQAANLGPARLESGPTFLDMTKEVFSVKDVRTGHEVKADLTELDMPFIVRGRSDLRLLIDDLRITVHREEGSDEIAVTVRQA